jgi:hypothetical protein
MEGVCEHLEHVTSGELRRLLINVPPGFMKSLLVCVFWPAWSWLRHPHTRWLMTSYAQDFAHRDSTRTRDLIRSEWYQERWADRFQIRQDGISPGDARQRRRHGCPRRLRGHGRSAEDRGGGQQGRSGLREQLVGQVLA